MFPLLTALLLGAASGHAEIIGELEAPRGFAAGIANVQGWVYTTTPGAELVEPFAVLIDGVERFRVPCCGDRGDVRAAKPDAPLRTGFSGVYNWGLAWAAAHDDAAGSAGATDPAAGAIRAVITVVVTDTSGDLKAFSETVDLWNPTPWPRSKLAQWTLPDPPAPAGLDSRQDITLPGSGSACTLSNEGLYTEGSAVLECTAMRFTAPDDTAESCPRLYFEWDRASQSFRLASDCLEPADGASD